MTVPLGRGSWGAPADLPVRVPVSRPALEALAATAGVRLPWQRPPTPRAAPLTTALGPLPGRSPTAAGAGDASAHEELLATGLLHADGTLPDPVQAALLTFARARAVVDIEVSARRLGSTSGPARLTAWHRCGDGRVTTITGTGGRLEVAWCGVAWWQRLLGRLVAAPGPAAATEAPAPGLELPLPLLLASGAALRTGRDDLLGRLLAHAPGQVRAPGPLPPAVAAAQLRLLHEGVAARLGVTVAGRGVGGDRRLGVVSWLLFADGWRSLVPLERRGEPWVRLEPVVPLRLGAEVARLVLRAGGRC